MSEAKSVLVHITTVPETLGFLCGQISFMKAQGFEVHALTSQGAAWTARSVEDEFVRIHRVKMHRKITPIADFFALINIIRVIKAVHAEIVHTHTPKAGLLGMIAAKMARVPVRVYHIHGLRFMTAKGYRRGLLFATERISCWLADQVFVVSQSVLQRVIDERICRPNKLKVLVNGSINGLDTEHRFNPELTTQQQRDLVRAQWGIPKDALVVGFVGRIVRDKGIEELVNAWDLLKSSNSNVHLLVVGRFEIYDPISQYAKRCLENRPDIHLTGAVTDIPRLYRAMDLLVLPSYREGLPYAPLEAAAMGLPVVATRVDGCVDVVQDGVTGTLVPAGDYKALASGISVYLKDAELRKRHGDAGREYVRQAFNQKAIWEATHAEYRRLIHQRGRHFWAPIGLWPRPNYSKTVMLIGSLPDSLVNFRGNLIQAMVRRGYQVVASAAIKDSLIGVNTIDVEGQLAKWGVVYRPYFLSRTGLNPFLELLTLLSLILIIRRERPSVVLSFSTKPILYGSLAARVAHVPAVYSMVTGVGSFYYDNTLQSKCVGRFSRICLRLALANNCKVFFQNSDDQHEFLRKSIIQDLSRTLVINGSGVDLKRYQPEPPVTNPMSFLLIARLLRDKGVLEYAKACEQLKTKYPSVRFFLVGPVDDHPNALSKKEVKSLRERGAVEYCGAQKDVRPFIAASSVFVLPSYHEGTPRTVLEAMAMARPIITTDVAGCRETVIEGENGYLVPAKDPTSLAEAMERFISNPELVATMGARSRQIAEKKYDVQKVNADILGTMGLGV